MKQVSSSRNQHSNEASRENVLAALQLRLGYVGAGQHQEVKWRKNIVSVTQAAALSLKAAEKLPTLRVNDIM